MAIKPPVGYGPKGAASQASSRFTDRESESEALRLSLEVHRRALDEDLIDGEAMNNVLVFWGIGGVGKSALSKCLEDWINGRSDQCGHWGTPPTGLGVVTARWDMRDKQMLKSPVLFYLKLRRALRDAGVRTAMLDIGIVALASKFNSSEGTGDRGRGLEALPGIAEQAIAETFPHAPAPDETQAVSRAERRLLNLVADQSAFGDAVDAFEDLPATVAQIMAGDADVQHLEHAVAGVGWLLTQDLVRIDGPERPLSVVFLDTFENLELDRQARDEHVINSVISALPLCLFVITGRRRVDWAENRSDLAVWGSFRWPSLARTHDGQDEPRQHLVGLLDEKDARELLEYYLATVGSPLEEGLEARLAETTQLPIHINAIVELARDFVRNSPGHVLTHEDLSGDLRAIVERIMERFTPEEARLLQAAAVAGNFDAPMLAAMAQTTVGAAQKFFDNALVQGVVGQHAFEYHLHDEVRELVLAAGHGVTHAWSDEDRKSAAERGLGHMEERLSGAKTLEDIDLRIGLLGLAYALTTSYRVDPPWVARELMDAPSKPRISRLLGTLVLDGRATSWAARLVRILARPIRERAEELEAFVQACPVYQVRRTARLQLAYALRQVGGDEDVLQILASLWEEEPDPWIASQVVVTHRMKGRYRDAVTAWLRYGTSADVPLGRLWLAQGHPHRACEAAKQRLDAAVDSGRSGSWIVEITIFVTEMQAWAGELSDSELDNMHRLALNVERQDGRRIYWTWRAIRHILDHDEVEAAWRGLLSIRGASEAPSPPVKQALQLVAGMRLLATEDETFVKKSDQVPQYSGYVPGVICDFLWEVLAMRGLTVSPQTVTDIQWIDDREVVKQRWIAIFDRLIDEARERCGVSAEQEG